MVITKIERQGRLPERVNVYLDGDFGFGIHREVLTKFRLRAGDRLDEKTIKEIQSVEEFNLAKRTALRLLGHHARSEKELRSRLLDKEFHPQIVDEVIDHLHKIGLIDDRQFAKAYIHDEQLRKPTGRRLMHQKLRLKGVPISIIRDVLDETGDIQEEESAALQAAKKVLRRFQTSRNPLERKKREQKVIEFLARRGFDWPTIHSVLRKLPDLEPRT